MQVSRTVVSPKASGATPRLCCATPRTTYRRSTTCKSPRKRAFIAQMEKFQSARQLPAGASNVTAFACANTVAMLGCGCIKAEEAVPMLTGPGGNDGNNGNGKKFFGGNNNNDDNNNSSNNGPDGSGIPLPRALLAAVAFAATFAAFPASSMATSGSPSSPPASISGSPLGSSFLSAPAAPAFGRSSLDARTAAPAPAPAPEAVPMGPRGKVMHVDFKGATLVIPLQGDGPATVQARGRVVPAPIALTAQEHRILVDRQYRVRESLLV